jgi:cytochrome P450
LSEAYRENPYPFLAELRRDDPVHFVPGLGFWFVTRYEDVRQLFVDPRVTPDRRRWERYVPAPEGSLMRKIAERGLFSLPPREHARVRRMVSAAFTPRAVARMDAQVAEVVEQYAKPLRGRRGVVDLAAEFCSPIPNAVISRITGIPAWSGDEERFVALAQDIVRGFFSFADPSLAEKAEKAYSEIAGWVSELADARSREPREDLISDLVQVRDGADRMQRDEVVMLVAGLLGAGSETTAIGGANSIRLLLEFPDQAARLRREPEWIPNAVKEVLRYGFGSGAGGLLRYAVEDFELHGKSIRKGQMLMLSTSSAHREPDLFPDPDRFDVARDTRTSIVFGQGPHLCLGANLARSEMACMLKASLDFLPERARLRSELQERVQLGFFSRYANLPVDFS